MENISASSVVNATGVPAGPHGPVVGVTPAMATWYKKTLDVPLTSYDLTSCGLFRVVPGEYTGNVDVNERCYQPLDKLVNQSRTTLVKAPAV